MSSDLIGCWSDLLGVDVPDGEGPLGVVGQLSAALHRHQIAAVLLLRLCGPVLVALPLRRHVRNTGGGKETRSVTFIRPQISYERRGASHSDDITHSSFLHQVGDHDDDADVLLPHHPPEV